MAKNALLPMPYARPGHENSSDPAHARTTPPHDRYKRQIHAEVHPLPEDGAGRERREEGLGRLDDVGEPHRVRRQAQDRAQLAEGVVHGDAEGAAQARDGGGRGTGDVARSGGLPRSSSCYRATTEAAAAGCPPDEARREGGQFRRVRDRPPHPERPQRDRVCRADA